MARHNQSVLYIEWMQPTWLPSWREQLTFQLAVILLAGFTCGLFGEVYGIWFGIWFPWASRWNWDGALGIANMYGAYGFGGGLLIGLGGMIVRSNLLIQPVERVHWVWSWASITSDSRVQPWARFGGLLGGALFGTITPYLIPGFRTPIDVLMLGIVGGLVGVCCGAAVYLLSCFLAVSYIEERIIPNEGIRRSLRNALHLFSATLVGLSVALVLPSPMISDGPALAMFTALIGLLPSLLVGLVNGGMACIQHLALRIMIYFHGYTPWRYIRFLNYAADRTFLRKVGGGYIFIHRMLLEYFASLLPNGKAD